MAYAKIYVPGDIAETDLFVEEADGQRSKERCARQSGWVLGFGTGFLGCVRYQELACLARRPTGSARKGECARRFGVGARVWDRVLGGC